MDFFLLVLRLAESIFWIVMACLAVVSLWRIANALEHMAGMAKTKDKPDDAVENDGKEDMDFDDEKYFKDEDENEVKKSGEKEQ
jgi:hypothetical protein